MLVDSIDWDAQLDAIRAVLARNRTAAEQISTNIAQLGEQAQTYSGPYHGHLIDEHADAMFRSSYSDAAVSLSAVGMIAPMMESVFSQALQSLGAMYAAKKMESPPHRRWKRAGTHPEREPDRDPKMGQILSVGSNQREALDLRDKVIDEMPKRMDSILGSFGRFAKNLPFELVSTAG